LIYLFELFDELPDIVPDRLGLWTSDWRIGQIQLRVGSQVLDIERVAAYLVSANHNDWLVGDPSGVVETGPIFHEVDIGGGDDEDVAGSAHHIDLVDHT